MLIPNLDALFAPLGASTFFAEYYENRPLHLRAEHDERQGLLSHDELLQALAVANALPADIVCFPEHMGTTKAELSSNPALLAEYLDAGHPLVWNRARGVSARIDALSALLANAFGGHVWPNVYATGAAGTPFDMHFDAHEVIAIHCAGEKTWDISNVRVNRPIEAVEMESAIARTLRTRRDEAARNISNTFTVCPGDLVYIPRGQFHNARTLSGRSLHVTFGIELPSGFDLVKRIVLEVLANPVFREYAPPVAMDPGGQRALAWYEDVASQLKKVASSEALASTREELRRVWERKSRGEDT